MLQPADHYLRGFAAHSPKPRLSRARRTTVALAIIFIGAPALAWFARPAAIMDLSMGNRMARSGLLVTQSACVDPFGSGYAARAGTGLWSQYKL